MRKVLIIGASGVGRTTLSCAIAKLMSDKISVVDLSETLKEELTTPEVFKITPNIIDLEPFIIPEEFYKKSGKHMGKKYRYKNKTFNI